MGFKAGRFNDIAGPEVEDAGGLIPVPEGPLEIDLVDRVDDLAARLISRQDDESLRNEQESAKLQAIVEERERCARVAESRGWESSHRPVMMHNEHRHDMANEIAAVIRKGAP